MKKTIANNLKALLLLVSTSVIFFACKKNIFPDTIPDNTTSIDFTTKVNSNVSGFVTNENNLPVIGAAVKVGSVTTTTNHFGFFEVRNVQVVKTAATVTIVNSGYFNGIKTYQAEDGKSAFFRIKLLPKTSVGTIASASGGTVTSNGVKVTLPANAVVNAATNVAYNGNISVAIKFINPTSSEINNIMPGDLRGIDGNSNLKLLTSYGMAAVELTGSAGELLQIATGKKATLTMPIPASILASSPASIPLWYFDEAKGLWKEEGSATKIGSEYIGEVSHFSFWNCDVSNLYVQFNCTLKNAAGEAISGMYVRIAEIANPNNSNYGWTDGAGYISGFIPNNANLRLEMYSSTLCNIPIQTQNFSTTNVNISLGNIVVTVPASNNGIVSGTVTNCNNSPVSNGRIFINYNNFYSQYPVNVNGSFSFSRILCGNSENVQIVAEDLSGNQIGNNQPLTILSGSNAVGNLQACGTTVNEFLNCTVNGSTTSFTSSISTFNQTVIGNLNSTYITNNTQPYGYSSLRFNNTNISLNSLQQLSSFSISSIADSSTIIPTPINVSITEYGAVGQYISGNFSGLLRGVNPPNTNYNVVCSFRMKRNQ